MGCPSGKGQGCRGFFIYFLFFYFLYGLTEVYGEILQDLDFRFVVEDFVH